MQFVWNACTAFLKFLVQAPASGKTMCSSAGKCLYPTTREVKAGEPEVKAHLQLQEFKARLGYPRPCLKNMFYERAAIVSLTISFIVSKGQARQ